MGASIAAFIPAFEVDNWVNFPIIYFDYPLKQFEEKSRGIKYSAYTQFGLYI